MSYRNKTYVIFDGDNDIWAYGFMKGWKTIEHLDFDFHDAHDLRPLTDRASEETVRRALRARFSSAKQVIVLVGDNTKYLYRFVRWEIQTAQELDLPIVVANLNGKRSQDEELCPPILKGWNAVHVPFRMKIIKHALDHFTDFYASIPVNQQTWWYYNDDVYASLGI